MTSFFLYWDVLVFPTEVADTRAPAPTVGQILTSKQQITARNITEIFCIFVIYCKFLKYSVERSCFGIYVGLNLFNFWPTADVCSALKPSNKHCLNFSFQCNLTFSFRIYSNYHRSFKSNLINYLII